MNSTGYNFQLINPWNNEARKSWDQKKKDISPRVRDKDEII